jgi:crotonobetainyl-CoA:carnitine CoA-transferase CaiB-like acyl-CoA transferase
VIDTYGKGVATDMKPLEGIKVLEFSTMITASLAAMMLADQGAEVIKVEPIDAGDPMRYIGSSKGGVSALFANCNRGKRSLRVDLKTAEGRTVIEQLAATTDIVLTNYRPGVMDGLGLGSAALRARNPRLIVGAVTGFGLEGPLADAPAYDPIIQAQSGMAAVQGQSKGKPEFIKTLMCDKITAYTVCQAVTSALYVRERTGLGQHIDLSMMDAGLHFVFPDGFMHQALLDDDVTHLPALNQLLYEVTDTSDGSVTISAATPKQQVGLLTAIERLDLFADERFNSMEKLIANVQAYRAELADTMSRMATDDLLARLAANDVPAARLLDFEDVFNHVQFAANGSVDVATHPQLGSMRRVMPPARFAGERLTPASHSPAHGEHSVEVLTELGYGADAIAALIESKVVSPVD